MRPKHGHAIAHEPDIDGELPGLVDKLARAVERVDEKEGRARAGQRAERGAFLGNNGNAARRLPQSIRAGITSASRSAAVTGEASDLCSTSTPVVK